MMKKWLIIFVLISVYSCNEGLERLAESDRNYTPLEKKFDCPYQSNDIFLLNEQNFETITNRCKTFNDSILGEKWATEIHTDLQDSLMRCLFPFSANNRINELYKLDSNELFNENDAIRMPNSYWDNVISTGDSFTYFEYMEHSVGMTFVLCFDAPKPIDGNVFHREKRDANRWYGLYRNAYQVDLNLTVYYRITPPKTVVGNKKFEYYKLVITDRCTLLRDAIGEHISESL